MLALGALAWLQVASCDVVLLDSGSDRLVRLVDLDADGVASGIHEASTLWQGVPPSTVRALDFAEGPGALAAFWVDSATDRVYRAVDLNGNARFEPFEEQLFRETGQLDGKATPVGLVALGQERVWWSSDGGTRGLFEALDLDGDGLAAGPAERRVLVDGDAPSHPVETDLGTVGVDPSRFFRMATTGSDVVLYARGAEEALFAFRDSNGDGDVVDPGESRLFLDAAGKNPALPRNVDWAAGKLRNLDIASSNGATFYGRLSHVAAAIEGGVEVWYLACDSGAGGPFATNVHGEGLNGLVFRGVDTNGDGDLQDAGEVRLFYDGSVTSPWPSLDQVLGMDAAGGAVWITYLLGFDIRVARLVDGSGDGDALDPGEIEPVFFDATATPAAGVDFVRGLTATLAGPLGDPNGLVTYAGDSCLVGGSGVLPTIHAVGHARVGTDELTIELRHVPIGSVGLLRIADDTTLWSGYLLPLDLGFLGLPGCVLEVGAAALRARLAEPFLEPSGAASATGRAEFRLHLPPDGLLGVDVRFQWLVLEPGGAISMTGRVGTLTEP